MATVDEPTVEADVFETVPNRRDRRRIRGRRVAAPASGQVRPSAREWFAYLLPILHASRPVVGQRVVVDRRKRATRTEPIYGKPTFRNVIDEDGQHV